MEMLKASAIQKPNSDGHVHFRSSESNGTGSRSLLVRNKSVEAEVLDRFGSFRYSRRVAILNEKGQLFALLQERYLTIESLRMTFTANSPFNDVHRINNQDIEMED